MFKEYDQTARTSVLVKGCNLTFRLEIIFYRRPLKAISATICFSFRVLHLKMGKNIIDKPRQNIGQPDFFNSRYHRKLQVRCLGDPNQEYCLMQTYKMSPSIPIDPGNTIFEKIQQSFRLQKSFVWTYFQPLFHNICLLNTVISR